MSSVTKKYGATFCSTATNNKKFASLMLLTRINVFLRPSEAEIQYRDNRPNRDMCERCLDDNLKTYALRALRGHTPKQGFVSANPNDLIGSLVTI